MLVLEQIMAIAVLAFIAIDIWIGGYFDLPEFVIAFVLCNIWMATISIRRRVSDE